MHDSGWVSLVYHQTNVVTGNFFSKIKRALIDANFIKNFLSSNTYIGGLIKCIVLVMIASLILSKYQQHHDEQTLADKLVIAPKINDIYFLDSLTGFIVGVESMSDGTGFDVIYKTVDAGLNWFEVLNEYNEPASWGISSISFVNEKMGIATSKYSRIYTTVDSGSKWSITTLNQVGGTIDNSSTISSEGMAFIINHKKGILNYDASLLGIVSSPSYSYKELTPYIHNLTSSISIPFDGAEIGYYKLKLFDSNNILVYQDYKFINVELKLDVDLKSGRYFILLEGENNYLKMIVNE